MKRKNTSRVGPCKKPRSPWNCARGDVVCVAADVVEDLFQRMYRLEKRTKTKDLKNFELHRTRCYAEDDLSENVGKESTNAFCVKGFKSHKDS